ncbi:MAG: hypothetical protein ABI462_07710 [Ignavibacteria bacterium]
MKIVKPTGSELNEYFLHNKKYFEQLADYYAIYDPEYYDNEFLKFENATAFSNGRTGIKSRYVLLFSLLFLVIFYLISFQFKLGDKNYELGKNSLSVHSIDDSDFTRGLDLYRTQQYSAAAECFEKVNDDDLKYDEALHMIELCRMKILEESSESNISSESIRTRP